MNFTVPEIEIKTFTTEEILTESAEIFTGSGATQDLPSDDFD